MAAFYVNSIFKYWWSYMDVVEILLMFTPCYTYFTCTRFRVAMLGDRGDQVTESSPLLRHADEVGKGVVAGDLV